MLYSMRFHYSVFAFLLVACSLLAFLFGLNPQLQLIASLHQQETELQTQMDSKLEMNRKIERLDPTEVQAMERIVDVIRRRVPAADQTAQFMAAVSALADSYAVGNIHFIMQGQSVVAQVQLPSLKGAAESFECRRIPLRLELVADFERLDRIFEAFAAMERITALTMLDLRRTPEGLSAAVELSIYALQPERAP